MKKDIIYVRSTLGKKRKHKNKKNKNSIITAERNMQRSENTGKLKVAMIILPVIIILIIITALFFGVREITKMSAQYNIENSRETSQVKEVFSPEDLENSEKLMTVVSPDNPLASDYKTDLVQYENIKIDRLVLNGLTQLMEDAKKEKLSLVITSGYVSKDEQDKLYQKEVNRLMQSENYSQARAETQAEKTFPKGNCADEQTGLSVKFSTESGKNFENSKEYIWLMQNAMKYGFVLRYPENKEYETGITANPSLFRYVGTENATKMRTLNMCLDEYAAYLNARNY
ncbi:MAG: M15 family metallopeptidase [Clostridia bacterium]|nr:M15 family metallopeptidase [Clostridia bacterium]